MPDIVAESRRHREPVKLPTSLVRGGVLAGVDLNDSAALLDLTELDVEFGAGDPGDSAER
jgi:hypothetical protein